MGQVQIFFLPFHLQITDKPNAFLERLFLERCNLQSPIPIFESNQLCFIAFDL